MTPHGSDGTGLVVDGIDLARPDLWDAYALGYQWGISYGITMGRQELAAELMPVGTVIADLKLWRGARYADLQRRRTTFARPALTAEQLNGQAVASWADHAVLAGVDQADRCGRR